MAHIKQFPLNHPQVHYNSLGTLTVCDPLNAWGNTTLVQRGKVQCAGALHPLLQFHSCRVSETFTFPTWWKIPLRKKKQFWCKLFHCIKLNMIWVSCVLRWKERLCPEVGRDRMKFSGTCSLFIRTSNFFSWGCASQGWTPWHFFFVEFLTMFSTKISISVSRVNYSWE